MSAFSFISTGFLLIDLSSPTNEIFAQRAALEAATSNVFKIKLRIRRHLFVPYVSGNALINFTENHQIYCKYPINSLERQSVILGLTASAAFQSKRQNRT